MSAFISASIFVQWEETVLQMLTVAVISSISMWAIRTHRHIWRVFRNFKRYLLCIAGNSGVDIVWSSLPNIWINDIEKARSHSNSYATNIIEIAFANVGNYARTFKIYIFFWKKREFFGSKKRCIFFRWCRQFMIKILS